MLKSRPDIKRKWLRAFSIIVVAALILVSAAALYDSTPVQAQTRYAGMPGLLIAPNITNDINVTFGRVSFINEPTQFQFSVVANTTRSVTKQTGEWLTNNSGYQVMQFNTSSTSPGVLDYNFSKDIGSNVSYVVFDSRIALNGTGNFYDVLSQAKQTALPATTSATNALAGEAQNLITVNASYSSTNKDFTIVVGYFKESSGSQVYSTVTMKATKGNSNTISPLQFAELEIYMQKTGTRAYLIDTSNDTVLANTSLFQSVAQGNMSKIQNMAYELTGAGSAILDYGWYVNHNAYASTATTYANSITPFIQAAGSVSWLPFDPNGTVFNTTHSPTSVSTYRGTNASLSAFNKVIQSNNTSVLQSNLINTTQVVNNTVSGDKYSAGSFTTTIRATDVNLGKYTGDIQESSFNSSDIYNGLKNVITQYIYDHAKNPTKTFPNGIDQIDVLSYIISNIATDTSFSSATASDFTTQLYKAIPGVLAANNLSLVNRTTGAVTAGWEAGSFYAVDGSGPFVSAEGALPATVTANGLIVDPWDGVAYSSLQAAGFPTGSYVQDGQVVVPQVKFYGFVNGEPVFNQKITPSLFGIGSLTGAAKAVGNFLTQGATDITNSVLPPPFTTSSQQLKASPTATPNAIRNASNSITALSQGVLPFIGGTLGGIGGDITNAIGSSTLTKDASNFISQASSDYGSLLAGVNSTKNYEYHLGASLQSLPSWIHNYTTTKFQQASAGFWSTINKWENDSSAVISPLFTEMKNIKGEVGNFNLTNSVDSIYGGVLGSNTSGRSLLNLLGNTFTKAKNGAISFYQNDLGKVGSWFVSAGGWLSDHAKGVWSFLVSSAHSVVSFLSGHWLEIVGIIAVIIIGAVFAAIGIPRIIGHAATSSVGTRNPAPPSRTAIAVRAVMSSFRGPFRRGI